jgi:squalene-hopene/tetraprenyl-beta-curcumene cyclase
VTLLAVETAQVDEEFGDRWRGWLRRQRWKPPKSPARASFDHFPFLLYEYFATVPMRAARHIALAARAMRTAAALRDATLRSHDPAGVEEAMQWLRSTARHELELVIPPAAPFWPTFDLAEPGSIASAHATAAAFAGLASQDDSLPVVNESQTHLYSGLVLFEGCLSWRADYVHGYRSPVVAQLEREMGGFATTESQRRASILCGGRRFYYGGVAERALDDAAEQLCRALAAVTDLPPAAWGALLSHRLDEISRLRADLRRIRLGQLAKVSRRPVRPIATNVGSAVAAEERRAAARAAASYLRSAQAPVGHWGDFLLLGQQSTSWVTGYVGWNLASSDPTAGDLGRAAHWLATHQLPDRGWGYNRHWPVDVDSTANALLFLVLRSEVTTDRWWPALERLLAAQHADGGFPTVLDPEAWLVRFRSSTADVSGWTASHPCVTAVVAQLLARLDDERTQTSATRALHHLLRRQRPEGYWDAYWWMGGLYTTCRAIEALSETHRRGKLSGTGPCLSRAGDWLTASQRADGGWAATEYGGSEAFQTALAVQALHALPTRPGVTAAAGGGLQWLVAHQLPDGSWPVSPILRVPRPDCVSPWDQTSWTESIVGLDVVVPDWRRVFTTVTAIRALRGAIDRRQHEPFSSRRPWPLPTYPPGRG